MYICFTGLMSNRKEALFAMLAVTSIGAIWSGPMAFFGARVSNDLNEFLIAFSTLDWVIIKIGAGSKTCQFIYSEKMTINWQF